ncbi:hypothetical protein ACIBUY_04270 [Streptomyces sp. NPDC050085]|uniref:hypothetical protein n=1 Tax=Streptomyces sp. NPDC050085 TaxID=3365600 RepID=UPI0037956494
MIYLISCCYALARCQGWAGDVAFFTALALTTLLLIASVLGSLALEEPEELSMLVFVLLLAALPVSVAATSPIGVHLETLLGTGAALFLPRFVYSLLDASPLE